jgi:hypothetical protein
MKQTLGRPDVSPINEACAGRANPAKSVRHWVPEGAGREASANLLLGLLLKAQADLGRLFVVYYTVSHS